MGYIIDARLFRLGYRATWASSWVADGNKYNIYLNEDFILNEFIKLTFLLEGVPYCTYHKHRWWNDAEIKKEKEPHSNTYTGGNPFMREGGDLLLSHACLNRKGKYMDVEIFLLDAELESFRLNADVEEEKTASTLMFDTFFDDETLDYKFKNEKEERKFSSSFSFQNTENSQKTKEQHESDQNLNIFSEIKKKPNLDSAQKMQRLLKKLIGIYYQKDRSIFYDSIMFFSKKKKNKYKIHVETENLGVMLEPDQSFFNLFKTLLRLFEGFAKPINKKNFFHLYLLRNLLEQLFTFCFFPETDSDMNFLQKIFFEENSISLPEIKIFMKELFQFYFSLVMLEFFNSSLLLAFFATISQTRSFLFRTLNLSIHNHINIITKAPQTVIIFYGLHSRNLSSNLLVNYIVTKLRQYFTIQKIMSPLISDLNSSDVFLGYKIVIAGRLTRKERAAYMVYKDGTTPSNSMGQHLDYAADFLPMKFGVVGVKVWTHLQRAQPVFYHYKFRNDL